ncbi:MAG: 2,3-bisphosphoglycerate-independent phosphoglycerate mutase [Chromatiales bacterium]|nr:2,3-bisphosphoglycerate-independent phosphoglycerate mutase [Chromatiales bacterium]
MQSKINKTLLVILDGYGISSDTNNNAVWVAKTPHLDRLFAEYPHTLLEASGPAVGLPPGQIGNSEVGHTTMGCGCVIPQDLVRIDNAIKDRSFFKNNTLLSAMQRAKENNRPIHLLGLVSDGGVHSHIRHLLALIELAAKTGCIPIVHVITDGRDTAPQCAHKFIQQLQAPLEQAGGAIATIIGRYYAMDRDARWDRTAAAWQVIAKAQGRQVRNVDDAIDSAYATGHSDEFIEPFYSDSHKALDEKDHLILFNFRNDRPRQLIKALACKHFDSFDRDDYQAINITTMTEIDHKLPCAVAYNPIRPKVTLAKVLSDLQLKQFHCAETEKYPHITFFFNGGIEEPLPGEKHYLVPSPKVSTYDLMPEMSAAAVADAVSSALAMPEYSFVVVNFANMDMVGHTAVPDPIIKAVETVDQQLGEIVNVALKHGWQVLITADHGNCDEMLDLATGQPNTMHTTNPVPCLIVNATKSPKLASGYSISSIAPTVLDMMGVDIPPEMEAPSVIVRY